MDFEAYQAHAMETAIYPGKGSGSLSYGALGLAGESGEVCEKVKKLLRDHNGLLDANQRMDFLLELGDVLWYLSALCHELGVSINDVAEMNVDKLAARKNAGTLHGNGDYR